ncbi:SWIM zinc finger family protein [Candidatus Halobeggiatoa sp. HSG11]|nr:SWIM zinc finger family protein [Candidatus Halobeggiatoa sp. HSG11]
MTKKFSRTWWGKRFIEALEEFSDTARLGRGRSYARNGKILNYEVENGKITAKVRGSVNPYFGVYKEPKYNVSIEIKQISAKNWSFAINQMAAKASVVSKLLLNEVPDNIENCFTKDALLLPHSSKDFKTACSCPDYANPCKHIAGVCYLVASQLDNDPFLLFELRGLSRKQLQQELAKSTLGKVLSSAIDANAETEIIAATSYYTKPKTVSLAKSVDLKDFWGTSKPPMPEVSQATVSAILIKKAGDFPSFWKKDNSFVEIMEDFYNRVRAKKF